MMTYENSTGSKSAVINLGDILNDYHNGLLTIPTVERGVHARLQVIAYFKQKLYDEGIRFVHFTEGTLYTFSAFIMANQAGA